MEFNDFKHKKIGDVLGRKVKYLNCETMRMRTGVVCEISMRNLWVRRDNEIEVAPYHLIDRVLPDK